MSEPIERLTGPTERLTGPGEGSADPTGAAPRGPLRLVVRSPSGDRVLGRPNGLAGWALPTIAADRPFIQWTAASVARACAAVGTDVVPVRRLGQDSWEFDARDRVPAAGTTWIGLEDVERLGVDASPARSVLLDDASPSGGHLSRGWLGRMENWIDDQFARTGPLQLMCHWELSAVVSFPTDAGTVVAKQNGPGFDAEAAIVAALAGVDHVPEILAADDDLVALPWSGTEGVEAVDIAAAFGRLHRSAADRADALVSSGIARTDDLARSIGDPRIAPHLAAVTDLGLEPTVVHGDAHAGNVLALDGDITVIDWTDAVVGPPVLDLPMIDWSEKPSPADSDPRGHERRVIEAWAAAHGCDPAPVAAVFPSIRVVSCAVTVALYDRHVGNLPASAHGFWSEWTADWRRRLDESLAATPTDG